MANRGIPMSSESLWIIALLAGRPGVEPAGTAHVLVFYDHTVGDGTSLCRVFADWLAAATRDVATTAPLPSRPLVASLARIFRDPATRRLSDRIKAAFVVPSLTQERVVSLVRIRLQVVRLSHEATGALLCKRRLGRFLSQGILVAPPSPLGLVAPLVYRLPVKGRLPA